MDPVTMAMVMFGASAGKAIFEGAFAVRGAASDARQATVAAGYKGLQAVKSNVLAAEMDVQDVFFAADRTREAALFYGERSARSAFDMADQASRNVDLTLRETAIEGDRMADQGRRVLGAQTAFYASNGIDVSEGAPVLMQAMSVRQLETDQALLRASGMAKAAGFAAQATSYAIRGQDALDEAALKIEDAAAGAEFSADRISRTLAARNADTLGEMALTIRAARKRQSNATAAALLKTGTSIFGAGVSAFGGMPR